LTIFLTELFKASIIGGILILMLILLRPVTRNLFSKTWHYYTGLIPALFLLGAAMVTNFIEIEKPAPVPAVTAVPVDMGNRETHEAHEIIVRETTPRLTFERPDIEQMLTLNIPFEQESVGSINMASLIFVIWLTGCVVFAVINTTSYIKLNRQLRRGDLRSPAISSPIVIGFIKPKIILPNRPYTEPELSMTLTHEQIHIKRGDMLIKLALLIINAIHWFNPAAYFLTKNTSTLCELSCDEIMVKDMKKQERI